MIVSSTVGRCCMAYLLLVTHTVLTSSSPIPNANNDKPKHMCGQEFSERVKVVCVHLKSIWKTPQDPSTSAAHVSKDSETKNVCCTIGCTLSDLKKYCAVVRNQTTEVVQNSQEVSSAIVTELIPQSTELLPTTETPSDSTPEYILNESLEQEAFTILSTYRTPQYSINSLQFL